MYQLSWATLPGLRGLGCSGFRATPIPPGAGPDNERGVAVDFSSDVERDAFLRRLEEHFAAPRFSNAATAFETVKAVVLEWAAKRS
jgi:hypothetical protein